MKKTNSINLKKSKPNSINIIDFPLNFKNCFKVSKLPSKIYVKGCLNLAHEICIDNGARGFINCPVDKELIKSKNIYGVTEFIAKKCNINKESEVMMLHNKNLSVVPITTHLNINQISKKN